MIKQNNDLKYRRAKLRVEREKGFYTHLIIYLLVNLAISVVKLWSYFGHWDKFAYKLRSIDLLSVWLIWGAFVILHYLSYKYGQDWQDRKIEQYIKEELSKDSK